MLYYNKMIRNVVKSLVQGIGIDSVQIDRIEKSIQSAGFLEKVFSKKEQDLLTKHKDKRKAELAAGCFAAKEAFLKAAGVGLGGFALSEISALRKESGQPYYLLSGKAEEYCEKNRIYPFLSLTHEAGIVTAFTVFEQNK